MAEIHKITKNGQTILPATTTDAVVHPDLQTPLTNLINEYNVSVLFPTSGIDGTDKYDLQTAIDVLDQHLSAEQKTVGIKVAFNTNSYNTERWIYFTNIGRFNDIKRWREKLSNEFYHYKTKYVQNSTNGNIRLDYQFKKGETTVIYWIESTRISNTRNIINTNYINDDGGANKFPEIKFISNNIARLVYTTEFNGHLNEFGYYTSDIVNNEGEVDIYLYKLKTDSKILGTILNYTTPIKFIETTTLSKNQEYEIEYTEDELKINNSDLISDINNSYIITVETEYTYPFNITFYTNNNYGDVTINVSNGFGFGIIKNSTSINYITKFIKYASDTRVVNPLSIKISRLENDNIYPLSVELLKLKEKNKELSDYFLPNYTYTITDTYTTEHYQTQIPIYVDETQLVKVKCVRNIDGPWQLLGGLRDGKYEWPSAPFNNNVAEFIGTFPSIWLGAWGNNTGNPFTSPVEVSYTVTIYNSTNIIQNDIEPIKRLIGSSYKETYYRYYIYNNTKPSQFDPKIKLKAGQKVHLKVTRSPVSSETWNYILGGSPKLHEGYINMTFNNNGIAEGTYTVDYDCKLGQLGYGDSEIFDKEFIVTFEIETYYPDDNNTITSKLNSIPKSEITFDNDFIESLKENPWQNISRTAGFAAIFRSWGFIGDSLCSGEFECYTEEGTRKFYDAYEYSWGQQICNICGSEGYNFSQGGQQAKNWLAGQTDRTWKGCSENPKDAYIIALGVNDSGRGETTPGNIDTDINFEDPDSNADTFAGNYAKIIQKVKSIQPKCIIFTVTMPVGESDWNKVIRGMADKFENVYTIDLEPLTTLYKSSDFRTKYYLHGHMSPVGYLYTAYLFINYIDYIVRTNPDKFKGVGLIGTEYLENNPTE